MMEDCGSVNRREFCVQALAGASAVCAGNLYGEDASEKQRRFRAGAAETIVTPKAEGTFLIGPMKPSTGVHDDLFARILLLDDGAKQAAIVTLDYLGFDVAYNDLLLAAVAEATEIPAGHVMINCSHNHSAPLTVPWGPWEKQKDRPFHKMLPRKLAEIARQARATMKPARVRYARQPVQIGFNRRLPSGERIVMAPNPHGAVLPWVDVVSLEDQHAKRIAVLFSHAAHPVIVHGSSTLITADYPGFAVNELRSARGKEGIFMFAQGCGGNINGFPLRGGIDAAAAAGRDLGNAVGRALDAKTEPISPSALKTHWQQVTLPLQDPPSVAECQELIAKEKSAERKARLEELLVVAQSGKQRTIRLDIRGFAVGRQLCILALSHEPFVEYQHFVERVSPFPHNMVLAYTNGLESYIGTENDYRLGERGGYETSPWGAAFMMENCLPLAPQCERLIQAGIAEALKQLHSR